MEFGDDEMKAMQDIQELDETSGTTLVGFGKYRLRSYHWVVEQDERYAKFVSSCPEPSPLLEEFQLWLRHYVEIPAVQSQQQSPSVENANKKKVHM
jgi:hypothetical protein